MKKWILSLVAVAALSALIYQVPQQAPLTADERPVYMGGPGPAGVIILADERPIYMGGPGPAGVIILADERPIYMGGPGPAGVIAVDFT